MFALILSLASACGGGGGKHEPGVAILKANGTLSVDGKKITPAYGVAGPDSSGDGVGVLLSDAAIGCSALTEDYDSTNMPEAGTYVAVGFPSFDKGVAKESYVAFTVVSGRDVNFALSNTSKVEVLDATDSAVTIDVEYRETMDDLGECVASGEFSVTRCPSATE